MSFLDLDDSGRFLHNADRNTRDIVECCVLVLMLAFIVFLPLGDPKDCVMVDFFKRITMYLMCILCKTTLRIILIVETVADFFRELFQHFLDFLDDLNLCVRHGVSEAKVSEDLIEAIERPDDSCKLSTPVYIPTTGMKKHT